MVRVPNRGSVRILNLIIHYVNGEIYGTEKRWSVFRDGPLCEAVRYRVYTVLILYTVQTNLSFMQTQIPLKLQHHDLKFYSG